MRRTRTGALLLLAAAVLATLPAATMAAERMPLPGAVEAYRVAIGLGHEDADFMLFVSPGLGQPALVVRFVPRQWRLRDHEAEQLFLRAIPRLAPADAFVAQVSAQARLGPLRDDPTAAADWTFWRGPDERWHLIEGDPGRFLAGRVAASEAAPDHERAFWEWQHGALLAASPQRGRAIALLEAAYHRTDSRNDGMRLRTRVAPVLIRLLHESGQQEAMTPYLEELARQRIAIPDPTDYAPLLRTAPALPRSARALRGDGLASARVVLRLTVASHGRATDIEVVEERPEGMGLAQAAVEAVANWVYLPRIEDETAVDTPGVVQIVTF
jgi:hypothetical protein